MTSRREPFLPLFVGDFLASTGEWTGEEQALYLLLLAHQWAVGSLPLEPEKIARLCRWDRKVFARCWATVASKFIERDGRLINQRLEEHREHANEISVRRANAGSKGGTKRAANAKQLPSNCQANASDLLQQAAKHQSINQEDSEAKASGAAAPQGPESAEPPDPRSAMWHLGVSVLGEGGRSLIGRACKAVGEPRVMQLLAEMASKPKADPKAWFVAATTEKPLRVMT